MSKEPLEVQTFVLKVHFHCDGCKRQVTKILHKIEGVYTTNIDSEKGTVTVTGKVDPAILIKKLRKKGKYAQLCEEPKPSDTDGGSQGPIGQQLQQLIKAFQDLQVPPFISSPYGYPTYPDHNPNPNPNPNPYLNPNPYPYPYPNPNPNPYSYPYSYPYPPPTNPHTPAFSDENPASCNVM